MRGDFVTVALQGDLGKPRPALVIQSDQYDEHATVTILPVTGTLIAAPLFRIAVRPSRANGLQKPSQVMVDKAMTVKRDKLGSPSAASKPMRWSTLSAAWRCSWASPSREIGRAHV